MKQNRKPCSECPFSRSTSKEYLDTKGQNGERFAGQAIAGFVLPCHMHPDFDACRQNLAESVQCGGAAKYRANIGVAEEMPPHISKLEPDHENVFSSPEELIAHHRGTSVEDAKAFLVHWPVPLLAAVEMQRATVTRHLVPRKG